MSGELRGPLRILGATANSGAGGDTSAVLRPPEGEVWDILMAKGSHNGAAGLTCQWYFTDTIGGLAEMMGQGATQPRLMNTDCGVSRIPLRLNHNLFISFQVLACGAGVTVAVAAILERITGVNAWTGA